MSEMGMAMMGTGVSAGENRAKEAAEAAISSPLLEDIDINDAHGVLVNITAGLDMSIGEFEAVGEVVKSFASEFATVVVGTVIDPEMTDSLRVTVVVTGLGKGAIVGGGVRTGEVEPVKLIDAVRLDAADYQNLERPAVIRKQPQTVQKVALELSTKDMDYLDIPAFLRRQDD